MNSAEALVSAAREAIGAQELLAELCDRSLIEAPDDFRNLVDIGIYARDGGLIDKSKTIFAHINARNPGNLFAYYELAFTHLLLGEHLDAVFCLSRLLQYSPTDTRANLLAARLLYMIGDPQRARSRLDRIDTMSPGAAIDIHKQISIVTQFGEFVGEFTSGRMLQTARIIEESSKYLNAHQVFEKINMAIRDTSGFSVVRAGDGEGAFVHISNTDESQYGELYAHNRRDRANVWFADTLDIVASGFERAAFGINDAIAEADIVGMPYESWVRHEYRIASLTGVVGLTNLLRLYRNESAQNFCSQNVHIDLQATGLLTKIIASQKSIGIISCQRELPDLLKSEFNFKHVWYHYVPGEKGHSHLLNQNSVQGAHWPDHFGATMAELGQPLKGRVYLVAAGILGKIYCAKIKKSGGLAIDIGAVADGWMGSKTRPGLPHFKF